MAVTIDRAKLAVALGVAATEDETLQTGQAAVLDRLLLSVTGQALEFAPDAPDHAHDEAAVRLAGWLYDSDPTRPRGTASPMLQSGAAAILMPYRVARYAVSSGAVSSSADGQPAQPAQPAGLYFDDLRDALRAGTNITISPNSGQETLTFSASGDISSVDQVARDAAERAEIEAAAAQASSNNKPTVTANPSSSGTAELLKLKVGAHTYNVRGYVGNYSLLSDSARNALRVGDLVTTDPGTAGNRFWMVSSAARIQNAAPGTVDAQGRSGWVPLGQPDFLDEPLNGSAFYYQGWSVLRDGTLFTCRAQGQYAAADIVDGSDWYQHGSSGSGSSYRGDYAATTTYSRGEIVRHAGRYWIVKSASTTGTEPSYFNSGAWTVLDGGMEYRGLHVSGTYYADGHIVEDAAGAIYIRRNGGGSSDLTDTTHWAGFAAGRELPTGGQPLQALVKASTDDYDVEWSAVGAPNRQLPAGGSDGQALTKSGDSDYAVGWVTPQAASPNGTTVLIPVRPGSDPDKLILRAVSVVPNVSSDRPDVPHFVAENEDSYTLAVAQARDYASDFAPFLGGAGGAGGGWVELGSFVARGSGTNAGNRNFYTDTGLDMPVGASLILMVGQIRANVEYTSLVVRYEDLPESADQTLVSTFSAGASVASIADGQTGSTVGHFGLGRGGNSLLSGYSPSIATSTTTRLYVYTQ